MKCCNCGADAGFNYTVERRGDAVQDFGVKHDYLGQNNNPNDDICTVQCRFCRHKTTVREWIEELDDIIDHDCYLFVEDDNEEATKA